MNNRSIHLILFLFLSVTCFSQSSFQNLRFRHITVDDGLPQSSISSIIQDKQGFMWFGTGDGLARYDGYEFVVYKNDPKDSSSIKNNNIKCLLEDDNGNIWVGHREGLSVLNTKTQKFAHYTADEKDSSSLSFNSVRAITKDKNGKIWIGTSNGLNLFQPEKENFKRYTFKDDANQIWSLYAGKDNFLWIGTYRGGGLLKMNMQTGEYTGYYHDEKDSSTIAQNYIVGIREDASGKLWIATRDYGLDLLDKASGKFTHYKNSAGNPNSLAANDLWSQMLIDRKNTLWVGTYSAGLSIYDRSKNNFSNVFHNPNADFSLSNNGIRSVCEDKTGLIWIGTLNGVNVFDPKKSRFEIFQNVPGIKNSLSGNEIICITRDKKNNIWVAIANEGVNRINTETGVITRFSYSKTDPVTSAWDGNNIKSVSCDSSGQIYIAIHGGNACVYDEKRNKFNPVVRGWCTFLMCDKNKTMWVATTDGMYNTNEKKWYEPQKNSETALGGRYIGFMINDRKGNIWIRTIRTLDCFDPDKKIFKHYSYDAEKPEVFTKDDIFCFYQDKKNRYWIGTVAGLLRFDPTDGKILERYNQSNGFANETIGTIEEDGYGNLWMSTNRGIIKFNPQTREVQNFGLSHGLPCTEFTGCSFKDNNGKMYFGSYKGMIAFQPEKTIPNKEKPGVLISGITVLNKPWISNNPDNTQSLTFGPDEYLFSIEIAASDFSGSAENQFMYKMEGLDENWISLGTKHEITFTNLNPGTYTLKIKAANNSGTWNDQPAELKIVVTPPWYKTKLFYGSICIALIALFWLYVKFRERKILKQKKILEVKVEERTYELRMEKEKVETANKEISIQKRLVEEKNKEVIDSIRYAQRIQQALMATDRYIEKQLLRLNRPKN